MRHSQTPPRHEPKPAKSAQKLSNAAFWCPKERWTSTVQRTASLGLALEASRGTVQHASETGKPQQDSSPTSQTRSAKKLSNVTFWWPKEKWNSTSTVQRTASLGLALEASRGTVQHASETGKPQQDSSPTSQTRSAKKFSNVTFWWPKETWNSTVQNAPPHQKPTSRQPMRNNQTPPRNEPKPNQNRVKKDETRPRKTHLHTKNQPLGSPCDTAKHHLDTSPNQPKAPKNSLTPLSDALKKDEPQPCNGRPRLDWP